MIFVTEYYSYSYLVIFEKPNNIRIRIQSSKHYSLTSVLVFGIAWYRYPAQL